LGLAPYSHLKMFLLFHIENLSGSCPYSHLNYFHPFIRILGLQNSIGGALFGFPSVRQGGE
jgi:hypothetical protein